MHKLVGQGYDGAASMSGHLRGVQAIIREKYKKATYLHCSAHSLNLVISSACSIADIKQCFGTLSLICNFFGSSPLRTQVLRQKIQQFMPDNRKQSLVNLCETRWVERHDAVIRLLELYEPVLRSLEYLEQNASNAETSAKAVQLLDAMHQSQFIVTLHVARELFSLTLPLCKVLQSTECDLADACKHVETVLSRVKEMRQNADTTFISILSDSKSLAAKLGIEMTHPRTRGKLSTDNDSSLNDFYRRTVFIPFLDHFIGELERRFIVHQSLLSSLSSIIPSKITGAEIPQLDTKSLEDLYGDILPEADCLKQEIALWRSKWENIPQVDRPSSALTALQACNPAYFPNVSLLLAVIATWPVSTATAERSFFEPEKAKNMVEKLNRRGQTNRPSSSVCTQNCSSLF